jgi:Cyclophilin type peptidyl-prolyl cis-trans isomerase/CLD
MPRSIGAQKLFRAQVEAEKTVPLEVVDGVQHHAGTLSMARTSDPNSGTSSFSILLGDAPHLNMQYTVFGCGFAAQRQALSFDCKYGTGLRLALSLSLSNHVHKFMSAFLLNRLSQLFLIGPGINAVTGVCSAGG